MRRVILFFPLLVFGLAQAQESASYQITESIFNAGGSPGESTLPSSTSYLVSLDVVGDASVAGPADGSSFRMEPGFLSAFLPPGEALNLRFFDHATLIWDVEGSGGDYGLYRGQITDPFDTDYGACVLPRPTSETATDADIPEPGNSFFYLITAWNRLEEEGPKGKTRDGFERNNPAPCP